MFYLYAIGSMLAYTIQNVLLVKHARKMDGLSLAFYRNTSFVITLSPLLLGTTQEEYGRLFEEWPILVMGGLSGALYLGTIFKSYQYLPVGIASALSRSMLTVLLVAIGWLFLDEKLSFVALALIGVIILGSLLLSFLKTEHLHLKKNFMLGVWIAAACAVPHALANITPTVLSRITNPLASGFFWEIGIAAGAAVLLLFRWMFFKIPLQKLAWKDIGMITLCSSPTLIGTGLFTMATRTGPLSIVIAIGSATLVMTSLLSWWLYKENLRVVQWLAIALVLLGIVGLKFV